jgi:H+/Cl- antiporter ClcA
MTGPTTDRLADFTTRPRVVILSAVAIMVGVISAFVALGLVRLIGLITQLAYYQRVTTTLVSPAGNQLGLWAILLPVAGGLIVGLMARYGSERIRGHGIPEALEAILIGTQSHEREGGNPPAAFLGAFHWNGRAVRRRGPDHHDGGRLRLTVRAGIPSHR